MYPVETINYLLSLGTVLLEAATVLLVLAYILPGRFEPLDQIARAARQWGMVAAFLAAFGGSMMTLLYSEVLGFVPCGLCWMQRAFLYPQAVLFALALWMKDRAVAMYAIALSTIGAVISLYQHYLQMGGADILPCPAAARAAVDCAQRFVFEFGYLTFPFMAFSLFSFLIALCLHLRRG